MGQRHGQLRRPQLAGLPARRTAAGARGHACYDQFIVGDFSAGGEYDETILWDRDTGRQRLLSWAAFRPTYRRTGQLERHGIDIAAAGDYDTDGRVDDLFLYDAAYRPVVRVVVPSQRARPAAPDGTWLRGYDVISVGSFMD